MKRSLKRTLAAVFGTAVLVGGLTACGGHHGGWSRMGDGDSTQMRERMIERAGKELKLDDAQKQRAQAQIDGWTNLQPQLPKAKRYTDYREMLATENVDLLSVVTSDHRHAQMVVDVRDRKSVV